MHEVQMRHHLSRRGGGGGHQVVVLIQPRGGAVIHHMAVLAQHQPVTHATGSFSVENVLV